MSDAAETATFWERYTTDPPFAQLVDEEARSVAESHGWSVRDIHDAELCPACGEPVLAVLESRAGADDWHPGTWETDPAGIRHTPRRCTWLTAHHTSRAAA